MYGAFKHLFKKQQGTESVEKENSHVQYVNSHTTLLFFLKYKEAGVEVEAVKPKPEEHIDSMLLCAYILQFEGLW